jgi:hypothetical protein
MPGVSVFKRKGDKIMWVADSAFTHGYDYRGVWYLLHLLPEGASG